jgi:ACT domain-containing protein
MSSSLPYSDSTWMQFLDFVFPCDEKLTHAEVQKALRNQGIDMTAAQQKLKSMLESARAQERLKNAPAMHEEALGLLARMSSKISSDLNTVRERVKSLLTTSPNQSMQTVYLRRLETASTDEDLRSLLEDLEKLQELDKGTKQ